MPELCQAIEQISERQGIACHRDEKKEDSAKEALEEFHKQTFQENQGVGGTSVQRRMGSAWQEAQFGKNEERKGACQNGRREREACR